MKKILLISLTAIVAIVNAYTAEAAELATTNYVKTGVQTRIKKVENATGGKIAVTTADGSIAETAVVPADLVSTAYVTSAVSGLATRAEADAVSSAEQDAINAAVTGLATRAEADAVSSAEQAAINTAVTGLASTAYVTSAVSGLATRAEADAVSAAEQAAINTAVTGLASTAYVTSAVSGLVTKAEADAVSAEEQKAITDAIAAEAANYATATQGTLADTINTSLTTNDTVNKANQVIGKLDATSVNGTTGYAAIYTGTAGGLTEMMITDTWVE